MSRIAEVVAESSGSDSYSPDQRPKDLCVSRRGRWQWGPARKVSLRSSSCECPAHGWCSVNYLGTELNSPVIQPLNDKPGSDADPQPHLQASGVVQRPVTRGGPGKGPRARPSAGTRHPPLPATFSPPPEAELSQVRALGLGDSPAESPAQPHGRTAWACPPGHAAFPLGLDLPS